MATYKGVGLDTTNARIRSGTSSDDISFDAQITATDALSVTGGTTTDTLTVTGDASVGGDFTVTGDIISRGAVDLVVQDNFIDLNFGNTTTTVESGGLTVQMRRANGFVAGTVTTFTAGSAGVANPTFTYTSGGSTTALAAGDVVVITGAAQAGNDGLFVVQAVSGATFPQTVTIKGIGTTAVSGDTPWAQNQFEADTGDSCTAFKTDLFVQLVADGVNFPDSSGSPFSIGTFLTAFYAGAVESNFTANGGYSTVESTLQSAYDGGNTITTSGNPIAFTLTNGNFTAAGAGSVNLTPTGASSFTSGAALTLTGGAASALSTSGGALTLDGAAGVNIQGNAGEIDITTSGLIDVNGSGGLDMDLSGAASAISSASQNLTIETTTSGDLNLISAATLDIDCVAAELDATGGLTAALSGGASSITSTSQNLSIATATSGELDLTSAGLLDINAGANLDIDVTGTFDMLASSTFSIDGTGASNVSADSGNLTLSTTTSGDINITSAADVDMDAATVEVDATASILMNAAAASNFTVTGAGLVLSTATSGTVQIASAGLIDMNAAANMDIDVTGTYDMLATSTFSIDGTGNCNTTATSGNMTVSTATSGNVILDSAAGDILLGNGNTADVVLDGQNGTVLSGTNDLSIVAGVSQFDVVYISTSGYDQADASAVATAFAVGLASEAGAATNGKVITMPQSAAADFTGGNPSAVGQRVYLSTTAGKVTLTPPSGSGNVVFQIGFVTSTTSRGGNVFPILFQPMFIAEIG